MAEQEGGAFCQLIELGEGIVQIAWWKCAERLVVAAHACQLVNAPTFATDLKINAQALRFELSGVGGKGWGGGLGGVFWHRSIDILFAL